METNSKPKKYSEMDNDEKFEYNQLCTGKVFFIGVPLIFFVRYLLLNVAIYDLHFTMEQVYPVWVVFKWVAGSIVALLVIYFNGRTPISGWPGRTFGG